MEIYNKPDQQPGEQISPQMYRTDTDMLINYDSIFDLVSDVEANKDNFKTWDISKLGNSNGWKFGNTYTNATETRQAIDAGRVNEQMLRDVEKYKIDLFNQYPELNELERSACKMKRKKIYAEEGDELDIDRFMCYADNMWVKKRKKHVRNSVKIYFNVSMSAGNGPEQIQKNMVAFAAISDIFQSAGISTEIHIGAATNYCRQEFPQTSVMTVKIKEASERLDIARLCSCGLPGVFRHFIFSARLGLVKNCPIDMGSTMHTQSDFVKEVKEFQNFDIWVTGDSLESKMSMTIQQVREVLNLNKGDE